MRTIIVGLVLLAGTVGAEARCDQYGNCYSSSGGYGGTTTYGNNYGTGSNWQNKSDSRGQSGYDSRGNAWSYDRSTGVYQNYGTGETRYNGRRY